MHRAWNIFGIAAVTVLLSLSAEAACGGGGYKPERREERRTVSQAPSVTYPVAQEVSYKQDSTGMKLYEKKYFDAHRGDLDLTPAQSKAAMALQEEFGAKGAKLDEDLKAAESNLAKCKGDCASERSRVTQLRTALLEHNREFENRLGRVLSFNQMEIYRGRFQ